MADEVDDLGQPPLRPEDAEPERPLARVTADGASFPLRAPDPVTGEQHVLAGDRVYLVAS